MSRYDVQAKEPDKYTVIVGWDKPLQTYFAQVIRKDSDRDFDPALWKGINPREISSVADLQQALKDYVDIPTEMQNALRFDMGPDESFHAREFSSRDKQAIATYEASCKESGEVPTNEGRMQWVREWRELDAEHNAEGLEIQQRENREYFSQPYFAVSEEHEAEVRGWLNETPAERDIDNDLGR